MRQIVQDYIDKLLECDLTHEYTCVNALQQTPWRINRFVVETLRQCWDSGQVWEGLPPKENLSLPKYPFSKEPKYLNEEEKEVFKEFKRERNKIHSFNNRSVSKRIQVERTIQLAEEYADRDKLWYVWQLDFRGRKYPVESFLSPQNADYSKALLEFANGVIVSNDDDARWLAIHGANVFGVDKVSLEDREIWAYMNVQNAVDVYNDPLTNKWWQEADKPWQALAWCYEWALYNNARQFGEPFETHLPCASDGSCNGLQHLSAMLRDKDGGKAVNLLPSDVPQDIYTDVAKRTTQLLEQQDTVLAQQLLEIGVCRKLTKRPVMIVPYSGTRHACTEYIKEALEEKCKGRNPWNDDFFKPSMYLSGFVWQAINEVIVSAHSVMDYVKEIARLYAKQGKMFEWVTPTGLLVRQTYNEQKTLRVKTHLNGSMVRLNYSKPIDDKVDIKKAASGASPNLVHSLDAAALTFTVGKCLEHRVTDFAMVHDSYGTHSPNMPLLNDKLREAFVEMYKEHDVLQEIYDSAVTSLAEGTDVPLPPNRGELDIEEVLNSDYFFA
jgi:DNA-directed RNA polymerase